MRTPHTPTRLLAAALLGALGGTAHADFSTQIDLSGALHYPAQLPGNESQLTAEQHSGTVTAPAGQTLALQRSASGVDGNGTSGSAAFNGDAHAEAGLLRMAAVVDAASTPAGQLAPFPHSDASMAGAASFRDSVLLFDPTQALGAPITATFSLVVDWATSFGGSGGDGGNRQGQAYVFSNFNVAGLLGLTNNHLRSSAGDATDTVDGPATLSFSNGQRIDIYGQLQVGAWTRLLGVSDQWVSSSSSSATPQAAFFYINGLPTLSAIGDNGHNYAGVSAVPEPHSAVLLLLGLGALAWRRSSTR